MSATDWNDAVTKLMAKTGASKEEAAEEALNKSGGGSYLAIDMIDKKSMATGKNLHSNLYASELEYIDDVPTKATRARKERGVDDDSIAKPRETPMYSPSLGLYALSKTCDSNGKAISFESCSRSFM